MTPNVLNPLLYAALSGFPGGVRVSNHGERAIPQLSTRVRGNQIVPCMVYAKGAEHYRVNCPYCGDREFRLWIHHLYGTLDPLTSELMRHQACCYNEGCLEDYDNVIDLWDQIESMFYGRHAYVAPPTTADEMVSRELQYVSLPGYCAPINLDQGSDGARYLRGRGYDLDALVTYYDVKTIVTPPEDKAWLKNYILIPIVQQGVVVGWQARYPGDKDWKAERYKKYYNLPGLQKSAMLYNADTASKYGTVVVVEGCTSAWRVGGPVTSLFGKTMSARQRLRLMEWKSVVLMLDGGLEERTAMKNMAEELRKQVPVCQVILPDKVDPGSLSRVENWQYIRKAAKADRVPLHLEVQ